MCIYIYSHIYKMYDAFMQAHKQHIYTHIQAHRHIPRSIAAMRFYVNIFMYVHIYQICINIYRGTQVHTTLHGSDEFFIYRFVVINQVLGCVCAPSSHVFPCLIYTGYRYIRIYIYSPYIYTAYIYIIHVHHGSSSWMRMHRY